ncbi:MAG: surface layer protein, partial [Oscillospiraceae bacterium]|nr:surface layer protein [Oscillospiraceae bacterium]
MFWSTAYSDHRQENYIEYTPNDIVKPQVAYGTKIASRETLPSTAKALEAGGDQVIAGINADYYVVNTGVPLGLVVTDGILRSSSSYVYGIGFRSDGTAFIGQPNLKLTAAAPGKSFDLAGFNKVRKSEGGIFMFSSDFGSTTMNTSSGVDVVLSLPSGNGTPELSIGGSITAPVDKVLESAGSLALSSGKIVLSVNSAGSAYDLNLLRPLK